MTLDKNIKKIVCLQIIPTMGIGGVETGARDLARFMSNEGIQNYILSETNDKNFNDKNINFLYLKDLKFKNLFDQRKIKKYLLNIIYKKKINLVHISSRAPAFFLINFLKINNIKVVTSIHNYYKPGFFLKNWYNSFLQKGDEVIFNSFFVKSSYIKNFDKRNNSHVIPRGVDMDYFKNIKKSSINKTKKILIPSRISNWKGHINLLHYFDKLEPNLKKDFKLVFISSHLSTFEKKIDETIKYLSLDKSVIFVKPTLDIRPYYEDCYLTINFSTRPEGFGRTISEALSMSRPTMAPNQGGTKEQLLKFDKNLLFDVSSYKSFYSALKYVIQNYQTIKKSGRNFVKLNYSSELMCKRTLSVYYKALTS